MRAILLISVLSFLTSTAAVAGEHAALPRTVRWRGGTPHAVTQAMQAARQGDYWKAGGFVQRVKVLNPKLSAYRERQLSTIMNVARSNAPAFEIAAGQSQLERARTATNVWARTFHLQKANEHVYTAITFLDSKMPGRLPQDLLKLRADVDKAFNRLHEPGAR